MDSTSSCARYADEYATDVFKLICDVLPVQRFENGSLVDATDNDKHELKQKFTEAIYASKRASAYVDFERKLAEKDAEIERLKQQLRQLEERPDLFVGTRTFQYSDGKIVTVSDATVTIDGEQKHVVKADVNQYGQFEYGTKDGYTVVVSDGGTWSSYTTGRRGDKTIWHTMTKIL